MIVVRGFAPAGAAEFSLGQCTAPVNAAGVLSCFSNLQVKEEGHPVDEMFFLLKPLLARYSAALAEIC